MAESVREIDTRRVRARLAGGTRVHIRTELVASVDEFLRVMKDHDTATAALIAWCRRHHPCDAEAIAITLHGDEEMAADRYHGPLQPQAGETLRRRRVWLHWGRRVLSEAENWYIPERLPPTMREAVAAGSRPYGAVVAALRPERTTLATLRTDEGGGDQSEAAAMLEQLAPAKGFSPPEAFVLHIHAIMTASGVMLAELHEHYRRDLLP